VVVGHPGDGRGFHIRALRCEGDGLAVTLRAPWDFDLPVDDGTDVPNEPSKEGARLGAVLAAAVDRVEPLARRRFPNMLPRCNDCAFRAGTTPNQCMSTQLDVLKCLIEAKPFYCHKGMAEGDAPKRLCTGATVLVNAFQADREQLSRFVERLRLLTSKAARKRRRRAARARGAR
jgi:hypothetical protein